MNKIIDYFFDEDEIKIEEYYKKLGIISIISFAIVIITIL